MIAKWLIQTFVWLIVFAVLLFVPAGTWHWPGAWVFLGFMLASGLLFGGWLAKSSPELLAERMRAPIQKDQPAADKKIIWAFGASALKSSATIFCPVSRLPDASRARNPFATNFLKAA